MLPGWLWRQRIQKRFELTGQDGDRVWGPIALIGVFALVGWLVAGMPMAWNIPEQLPFMVEGGVSATPEFMAILIGLVIYTAAFIAEVVRGGIQSVSRGQDEAAAALGLNQKQKMNQVILPQAMRIIIPPTGNQFIAMLKDSSLVSVVGVWELMYLARTQGQTEFRHIEMLITASMIYWLLSIGLEYAQSRIEARFGRSNAR